ncbi:Os02g0654666 [Oryza sativa Japonica Group]|uniref:Os02g0654666 protein n=2 Tax=Oryza sativa subsp. japonica TaxID=39947 RepID=Q6H7H7_ORYSJ|nr:hypothetical protein [Oryza sativa Japonica Group]BAS80086.1 Os02g0654666 [Oryza sativa Japonica Group]
MPLIQPTTHQLPNSFSPHDDFARRAVYADAATHRLPALPPDSRVATPTPGASRCPRRQDCTKTKPLPTKTHQLRVRRSWLPACLPASPAFDFDDRRSSDHLADLVLVSVKDSKSRCLLLD